MRPMIVLFVLWVFCQAANAQQARQTYEIVVSGMNCHQNQQRDMECNYRVGRSLHLGIVGVGQKDPSIYFYEASRKGDSSRCLGYHTVALWSGPAWPCLSFQDLI